MRSYPIRGSLVRISVPHPVPARVHLLGPNRVGAAKVRAGVLGRY